MKFLVVTFAPTIKKDEGYFSYGPYVKEMDIWFENVDQVRICSPTEYTYGNLLLSQFKRSDIEVDTLPEISLIGLKNKFRSLLFLPLIFFKLFRSMMWADHIHFRAPGNIVLIGLVVQVFFPFKKKTVKYAGNWTNYAGQPWSYKLQKKIVSSTWFSKNMKVLVYGEWPGQSRNIVPFFTASYSANEIRPLNKRNLSGTLQLVFVGGLLKSKNPLLSILVAEFLYANGVNVHLQLLGDGAERDTLNNYIQEKKLGDVVSLRGNVPAEEVKAVLQQTHFLVFLSNSEGWPKAVAEAMFWGCIPVTKPVSCVAWMLDKGKRGILVEDTAVPQLVQSLLDLWRDTTRYEQMVEAAAEWSRVYTLEKFTSAIQSLFK